MVQSGWGIAVATTALVACGHVEEPARPAPVPLEQFLERYTEQVCTYIVACRTDEGRAPFATLDGCVADARASAEWQQVAALLARAKSGELTYNPALAAECIQVKPECSGPGRHITWTSLLYPRGACRRYLTGRRAIGARCGWSHECESDSCEGADRNCGGTCRKKAADGSCSWWDSCANGHECVGGRCLPPGQLGEPCTTGCAPGLSCADDGICVFPPGPGEPCARHGGPKCASGLACRADRCTACSGTCPGLVDLGGACGTSAQCNGDDLRCFEGRCAAASREGQPCVRALDCEAGLICDAGRCSKEQKGGSCEPVGPNVCASPLRCSVFGTCDDPPLPGESCFAVPAICPTPLACVSDGDRAICDVCE